MKWNSFWGTKGVIRKSKQRLRSYHASLLTLAEKSSLGCLIGNSIRCLQRSPNHQHYQYPFSIPKVVLHYRLLVRLFTEHGHRFESILPNSARALYRKVKSPRLPPNFPPSPFPMFPMPIKLKCNSTDSWKKKKQYHQSFMSSKCRKAY